MKLNVDILQMVYSNNSMLCNALNTLSFLKLSHLHSVILLFVNYFPLYSHKVLTLLHTKVYHFCQ
jgi:hypothetical protein